ncbi:MAG TPA: hypothetical protein VL651_11220, partial [Bacteroidia bacterium]|nr:hypothetical protein [Bacteroidia bacterium]
MKKLIPLFALAFIIVQCSENSTPESKNKITYPVTRKVDTVDDYFGTKVPDPYRWLEDDNSDS